MVKKWYQKNGAKVDIAGFMNDSKVSISTTIKLSDRKFVVENGLKYSALLTQIIDEYRGLAYGNTRTKAEVETLLKKWISKFTRLQKHLVKVVGEEKTAEFIKNSEFMDKVIDKLESNKKGESYIK